MAQLSNTYPLITDDAFETFEFISEGPSRSVTKRIEFSAFPENPVVVNLAFGDWEIGKDLDDSIVTNNGDTDKILSTVAKAGLVFLQHHPDKIIFATGSTHSRNRLYRMAITKHLHSFPKEIVVMGYTGDDWEIFTKGKEYIAYQIQLVTEHSTL